MTAKIRENPGDHNGPRWSHFGTAIQIGNEKSAQSFLAYKFFQIRDVPTQIPGHPSHSLSKTTEKGNLHKVFVRDIPTSGSRMSQEYPAQKLYVWAAFSDLNKWGAYRDTNGRSTDNISLSSERRGHRELQYKLEACCNTNWRCIAILFLRSRGGWGFDSLLKNCSNNTHEDEPCRKPHHAAISKFARNGQRSQPRLD